MTYPHEDQPSMMGSTRDDEIKRMFRDLTVLLWILIAGIVIQVAAIIWILWDNLL